MTQAAAPASAGGAGEPAVARVARRRLRACGGLVRAAGVPGEDAQPEAGGERLDVGAIRGRSRPPGARRDRSSRRLPRRLARRRRRGRRRRAPRWSRGHRSRRRGSVAPAWRCVAERARDDGARTRPWRGCSPASNRRHSPCRQRSAAQLSSVQRSSVQLRGAAPFCRAVSGLSRSAVEECLPPALAGLAVERGVARRGRLSPAAAWSSTTTTVSPGRTRPKRLRATASMYSSEARYSRRPSSSAIWPLQLRDVALRPRDAVRRAGSSGWRSGRQRRAKRASSRAAAASSSGTGPNGSRRTLRGEDTALLASAPPRITVAALSDRQCSCHNAPVTMLLSRC